MKLREFEALVNFVLGPPLQDVDCFDVSGPDHRVDPDRVPRLAHDLGEVEVLRVAAPVDDAHFGHLVADLAAVLGILDLEPVLLTYQFF